MSQKIRFASSIGSSRISWYENQSTIDLGAQLSFKLPQKRYEIYAKVKTLGNLQTASVDRTNYAFVEPPITQNNTPLSQSAGLFSNYRGGQAQFGVLWHFASGLQPIIELYSKSIARKISYDRTQYIEEEKYALHGISLGLQYEAKIKASKLILHGKLFKPLYHNIKVYGKNMGVPIESVKTSNALSFQTGLEVRVKKYGLALQYELLNMGEANMPTSKSIPATEAQFVSSLLTYYF